MLKKSLWLSLVYLVLCMSPYFVPSMNQLDPHFGTIPFTVWFSILLVIIYCVLLAIWALKLWDPMDKGLESQEEADHQNRREGVK